MFSVRPRQVAVRLPVAWWLFLTLRIKVIGEYIMNQEKRWITESLERKAFEDIIRKAFNKYKDNLMCSQETMNNIIIDVTREIREQLQGLKRDYLKK
jgi:hypothetical protein